MEVVQQHLATTRCAASCSARSERPSAAACRSRATGSGIQRARRRGDARPDVQRLGRTHRRRARRSPGADAAAGSIHRKPPAFDEQSPASRSAGDRHQGHRPAGALSASGGKIGLFGGAGVGKTVLIQELIHNVATRARRLFRSSPASASAAARATTSGTRCTRAALSTRPRSSSAR